MKRKDKKYKCGCICNCKVFTTIKNSICIRCNPHAQRVLSKKERKGMKYPKLPIELDRRRVLSLQEIDEIKRLSKEGWGKRELGRKFGVSHTTIRYYTNIGLAERLNKKRYQEIKNRITIDPIFAKKHKDAKKQSLKEGLKKLGARKIYKGKATYKWKKKKYNTDTTFREKTKEEARNAYHNKRLQMITSPKDKLLK